MRAQRKMVLMVVMVLVVMGYTYLFLLSSTKETNTTRRQVNMEEEEKKMKILQEEEEEEEEKGKKITEEKERETAPEEDKKKQEEAENKKDKEETKEEGKEKGGGGGGKGGRGGKKGGRKAAWVKEIEEYSPSFVNMEEMEEEMRRRRSRMEQSCGEILTEERKKELNSGEFLISKKYKLVWCNVFKAASSTWLYNYLKMAGRFPEQLKSLKVSPVEAARHLYPRPSPAELRRYLGQSSEVDEDAGEGYLSFIIVREPFQRLLSAFRDKIEKILPYYRRLRCEMTRGTSNTQSLLWWKKSCTPSFPQFVDYVLKTEKKGGAHNEHWAPYYRFCTPCSAHFDLILRFESLHQDEAYLLEKVPGLSKVVSPMVIHSSHTNYSSILAKYYRHLTPAQMLGLIKMYLPDFWLFGYNDRPYLDLVS